jgi:hypothetical protein
MSTAVKKAVGEELFFVFETLRLELDERSGYKELLTVP